MITLVIGGSGSGKSQYAEHCCDGSYTKKYYIATMQPFDGEMEKKITRHQKMRACKGFTTIEKYRFLSQLSSEDINYDSVILLECMSNLLANEYFGGDLAVEKKKLCNRMIEDITYLSTLGKDLVIVTNDVFASGEEYEEETMAYITMLGWINGQLAKLADRVVEVVCGIEVMVKGEKE